jgi:hypothetical protein
MKSVVIKNEMDFQNLPVAFDGVCCLLYLQDNLLRRSLCLWDVLLHGLPFCLAHRLREEI